MTLSQHPDERAAADDRALVLAFEEAVRQNGRVSGADSVSAYHELDDADEVTPREALLARLTILRQQLTEAQADRDRMNWLDVAVPNGEFRRHVDALPRIWPGSVRALVDAARLASSSEKANG